MRRLPPNLAAIGYSPRRYAPLSPATVLDMGQRLTDLREMQLLFANGEQGGYWPSDPAYAFENSDGTTAASVNGVVGYRTDVALGKHAIQATTGNKPIRRTTPVSGKTWYDSNVSTGALTATFAGALGSACTVATVTPEGVTIAENQTVGATYNICPKYQYNSDVLIINRALTAAEKAIVTRVMQRSMPGLGQEMVTNWTFDTNVGSWQVSAETTVTWENGAARHFGETTTFSRIYSAFMRFIAGAQYYASADIIERSANDTSFRAANNNTSILAYTALTINNPRICCIPSASTDLGNVLVANTNSRTTNRLIGSMSCKELI